MKKVVVIGAGPAGLTAAYELLSEGDGAFHVTVLEETGELGGISRTVRHAGNRMDIGGHRFFSKDERVMNWWRALLPVQGSLSFDDEKLGRGKPLCEGGPDPAREDRVMLVRTRISRIYYNGKFFDYPISMKWQTVRNMGFFTTAKAGLSYLKAAIFKNPEDSLETFYINRFGKVLYGMFFEGYTEKVWGRHPSKLSADWGAQRVRGLSLVAILKDMAARLFRKRRSAEEVETSLIEQFLYPKYGPGQLWEIVAAEVERMGGRIEKNTRASGIAAAGPRVTAVRAQTPQGSAEYEADIVFSSMPVRDLVQGMGSAVPCEIREIAAGLPYRDFVTVGLLVRRLNLKNETGIPTLGGVVPDCWIYVQDAGVKLGRIQIFNNWSPYMVEKPEDTVWIGLEYFCAEGDGFWSMEEDACVSFAAGELVKMGVLTSEAEVLASHRERVKKAYPSYFDTYSRMDELVSFLSGFENLYCIGRNGQHRYNNMDHSMATAFEAVKNVTENRADKSGVWNVNTESSYHEAKGPRDRA